MGASHLRQLESLFNATAGSSDSNERLVRTATAIAATQSPYCAGPLGGAPGQADSPAIRLDCLGI